MRYMLVVAALLSIVLPFGCLSAAEKDISTEFESCFSGTSTSVGMNPETWGASYEFWGAIIAKDANSPFHQMSYHCVGASIRKGSLPAHHTFCETIDKDGHKYFSELQGEDGKGGTGKYLGGTGKFAGITGANEYSPLGTWPTPQPGRFQGCTRTVVKAKLPQ